ncbi:TetR/AcrR family transcriptional regulator [Haloechinothrix halophila]|uniref:TetR/AcrR family transcriptional regulator n=1 Tax=Haloechinothrix halophila TaxID=1069073 RepID=UPI00040F225A|nr:TetR/AcrR family transcriptional regulator [Haloechinothrix halophila]
MTSVRQPQQDRSRQTRRRLLDAAVACLTELGWTRTTVVVVAERAGVSRGAAQHHFPTREDLINAAVNYVSEVQLEELADQVAALPTDGTRRRAVVEMLLNLYTGPSFRAALHLWVAASTDEPLGALIKPLERQVGREAHRMAVNLLDVDESVPGVRETVQATLDLARGLGLANLLSDDTARRARIVAQWTSMLEAELSAATVS